MVDLINKSSRDAIGIDSFKRAIVFAAFILRRNYLELADERKKNLIKITPSLIFIGSTPTANLKIEATLAASLESVSQSGDLIDSLISEVGNLAYTGNNLTPSTDNIAVIKDDIFGLDSLEKYLLWSAYEYQLDIINNQRVDKYRSLEINNSFNLISDLQSISIVAQIPYDQIKYLQSGNYLEAIGHEPIINQLPTDFDQLSIDETIAVDNTEQFILN